MARFLRPSLVTVALAATLILAGPAGAELVRVPGSAVRMDPPPGFTKADRFAGFQNTERGASIMVTEIPGPVTEVRRGMNAQGLASRGMTLIESETVALRGGDALLLHASQTAEGVPYLKWILVGGTSDRTVMIVASFPAAFPDLSDPIRASLLTVSWAGPEPRDRFEGLPFRVEATPRLRVADRMGDLLVFSESGAITPGNTEMAILVVGGSHSPVAIDDLESFARARANQTERIRGFTQRSGAPIVVDGLNGYELTGTGTDRKLNRSLGVYQLLLVDGDTYYIAQGLVTRSRLKEVLPVFRAVARSFQRVGEPERPRITQ